MICRMARLSVKIPTPLHNPTPKKAHCDDQITVGIQIGKVARLLACAFPNETDLPQTISFTE